MVCTKQTAREGVGGGKALATFPPAPSSNGNNEGGGGSDSGGSTGKAACMAKQLAAKTAKTQRCARSTRYYQHPLVFRDATEQIKRKKPGTVSLAELRYYQKAVGMLIPLLPFSRLVREIVDDQKKELRFQSSAIKALQEGAEVYLIGMLEDAQLSAIHTKCKTVMPRAITLAHRLHRDKVSGDDIESSAQFYAQTKPRGAYAS